MEKNRFFQNSRLEYPLKERQVAKICMDAC